MKNVIGLRRSVSIALCVSMLSATLAVVPQSQKPAEAAKPSNTTSSATEAQALQLARKHDKEVQVESLTTQNKTVSVTPKGQYVANLSSGPVRTQRADGSWVDLNPTLAKTGTNVWRPKVGGNDISINSQRVYRTTTKKVRGKRVKKRVLVGTTVASTKFPAGSTPLYAKARLNPKVAATTPVGWPRGISRAKHDPQIKIIVPGRQISTPTTAGSIATIKNVKPGVDLKLQSTATGVVPNLLLTKQPIKRTTVDLQLALSGLRLKATKAGYQISDNRGRIIAAGGKALTFSPSLTRPIGSAQAAGSASVTVRGSTLRFTLDPKRFRGAKAAYPIASDSVAAAPQVTTNGYVWSAAPSSSYMTQETNLVGKFAAQKSVGRMFVAFDDSAIRGTLVTQATLSMYQRDGSACTQPRVLVTTPAASWNSKLTWANQPKQTGKYYGFSDTQGHVKGQPSPCNPGFINPSILTGWVDILPLVKGWAAGTIPNNGLIAMSDDETSDASARVITSTRTTAMFEGLSISVTYYPTPDAPTNPQVTPMTDGVTPTDQPRLSAVLPTKCGLGDQICQAKFQVVDPDDTVVWQSPYPVSGKPGERVETIVSSNVLKDDVAYTLKVFAMVSSQAGAISKTSADLNFRVDQLGPDNPTITANYLSGYSNGQWKNPAPAPAYKSFTFSSHGAAAFQVLLDGVSQPNVVASSGSATMKWDVPDGWHTIKVWGVDKAGNQSHEPATYSFGSGGAGISSPTDQARSASAFQVAASAPMKSGDLARKVNASWQRQGDGDNWTDLSEGLLSNGGEWNRNPQERSPGVFTPADLIWDTTKTPGIGNDPVLLNLRLCFTFLIDSDNPECATKKVQISKHAFGGNFATANVGPGAVSLLTGELQIASSDAALPGSDITAGRVWLSQATGPNGVFGKGWEASTPAPSVGAANASIKNSTAQGVIILTQPTGAIETYVRKDGGSGAGTYIGAGLTAQTSSKIEYTTGATQRMVLTDTAGNTTTFSSTNGGNSWMGTQVDEAGPHGVTAISRDGDATIAVTGVYTDNGDEGDCANLPTATALTTRGCRALTMNVAPASTPKPTGDAVGDFPGQVKNVTVTQWDVEKKAVAEPVVVSSYTYDAAGMLRQQWDPTQNTSKGPLRNQYAYTSPGNDEQPKMTALVPASAVVDGTPSLAPFTFTYDGGKLTGVSRRDPSNNENSPTTIDYGVSVAGDGNSLPNLRSDTTPTWDQAASDAPKTATAVFYPDPNHGWSIGDSPSGADSDDWKFADITYMNEIGATTNTAVFGDNQWLVNTITYDEQQRVTTSLSAANRAVALSGDKCNGPAAVCAQAASMQRARMLQSITKYDDALQVPVDSWGPAFDGVTSKTPTGATETIRTRTQTAYNEGKPSGDEYANITLATTVKTSATKATPVTDGSTGDNIDTKTTKSGYSPVIGGADGWILREPTSVTQVMPGSDDIVTKTKYNSEGNPVNVINPGSNGSDAGTTLNEYYTGADSSDSSQCASKPEWDGAICISKPANAGDTGAPPTTTTAYSTWMAVSSTTDRASNGSTKVVTNTYEADSKKLRSVAISSNGGSDKAMPTRVMTYDDNTGGLVTSSAGDETVTSTFDHFGRQTSSTDSHGVVTSTTYDIASRPVTVDDSKGTYTYTYDSEAERRGLVTHQDTGIGGGRPTEITASYGTTGAPKQVIYPNAVKADFTYNTVGGLTSKTYRDHADTAMLAWHQTYSGFGQVATETGQCSLGQRTRTYTYDDAARLINSSEKCASASTSRNYTFDVASNRTKLVEKQNALTTTWSNTFDSASRQLSTTSSGSSSGSGTYSYDTFGRTTVLPGIDATPNSDTTLAYYADGSTYSQSQAGTTQTFDRDPLGRVDTSTSQSGGSQKATTNHFAGTGESPTWSETGNKWKRNVSGPGGSLAILQEGTGEDTSSANLQLISPHGDIVATIDLKTDIDSSQMSAISDYDEYGVVTTATAPSPYGWVGDSMRSNANQAGLIQMGARMYNPSTGRFLTPDPVPGGTPNPYTYPVDPVNDYDLDGTWSLGGLIQGAVNLVRRAIQWVANKATAAFSAAVRTVTFGRININIPKIKIPKFKIKMTSLRFLTRIDAMPALGGYKISINLNKIETIKLKDTTTNISEYMTGASAIMTIASVASAARVHPVVGISVAGLGLIYGSAVAAIHGTASEQADQGGCVSVSLQGFWPSADRISC